VSYVFCGRLRNERKEKDSGRDEVHSSGSERGQFLSSELVIKSTLAQLRCQLPSFEGEQPRQLIIICRRKVFRRRTVKRSTVVDFSATWCVCRKDMTPTLHRERCIGSKTGRYFLAGLERHGGDRERLRGCLA
jgi:hypothetical protein